MIVITQSYPLLSCNHGIFDLVSKLENWLTKTLHYRMEDTLQVLVWKNGGKNGYFSPRIFCDWPVFLKLKTKKQSEAHPGTLARMHNLAKIRQQGREGVHNLPILANLWRKNEHCKA